MKNFHVCSCYCRAKEANEKPCNLATVSRLHHLDNDLSMSLLFLHMKVLFSLTLCRRRGVSLNLPVEHRRLVFYNQCAPAIAELTRIQFCW